MKVDLVEFLRTGVFGKLKLGMAERDVQSIVGPPEDYSTSLSEPFIWKMGVCEIMFEHGQVMSIEQKFNETGHWPPIEYEPESWRVVRELTPVELPKRAEEMRFAIVDRVEPQYLPGTVLYLLDNNVRIVFEKGQIQTASVLRSARRAVH